jgi:uncharacterized protein (TIGR02145 family)
VPTEGDWSLLASYLGNNSNHQLREVGTEHWNSDNTAATNESGFTALPAGRYRYYRHENPEYSGYYSMGYDAYFWTSTGSTYMDQYDYSAWHYATGVRINTSPSLQISQYYDIIDRLSVRCLRDD